MQKRGALPDSLILEMMKNGCISGGKDSTPGPASLDVRLSGECYRIKGSFIPNPGEEVFAVAKEIGLSHYDLKHPLFVGETYLIPIQEEFALPPSVYAYANPKSSTGRNDVHVRIVADGVACFDKIPKGYNKGKVWAIVNPNSYPVLMHEGLPVSQLRYFNGDTRLSDLEMSIVNTKANAFIYSAEGVPIAYNDMDGNDGDGSLILTIDLQSELVGYVARHTQEVFDFNSPNSSVPWNMFYNPVHTSGGVLEMAEKDFYILSTAESVRVPPEYACEAVDLDSRRGDFRTHYAGFIDPGWGYGEDGKGIGRTITLEVRSNERRLCFRHRQAISRFRYERMIEVPSRHYDILAGSNYKVQSGPKLSKHFRMD